MYLFTVGWLVLSCELNGMLVAYSGDVKDKFWFVKSRKEHRLKKQEDRTLMVASSSPSAVSMNLRNVLSF